MQRRDHRSAEVKSTAVQNPRSVAEVVESSVKGEDRPMGKKHPTAPAALIWFSYPIGLVVILLLGLAALAIYG